MNETPNDMDKHFAVSAARQTKTTVHENVRFITIRSEKRFIVIENVIAVQLTITKGSQQIRSILEVIVSFEGKSS